jgi:hypothetical protein
MMTSHSDRYRIEVRIPADLRNGTPATATDTETGRTVEIKALPYVAPSDCAGLVAFLGDAEPIAWELAGELTESAREVQSFDPVLFDLVERARRAIYEHGEC